MSVKSNSLDFFFNPKTVAIIGASESLKFGYTMTNYLLKSSFKTYPVNISKEKIFGYKTYKRISDSVRWLNFRSQYPHSLRRQYQDYHLHSLVLAEKGK